MTDALKDEILIKLIAQKNLIIECMMNNTCTHRMELLKEEARNTNSAIHNYINKIKVLSK